LLVPLALVPALAWTAVRGDSVAYSGGTRTDIKQGQGGKLNLEDAKDLVFVYAGKKTVRVPYASIKSMELGQRTGNRVGSAVASGGLIFAKTKKHFLTLVYTNSQSGEETLVFELAKGVVAKVVRTLQSRTGKKIDY